MAIVEFSQPAQAATSMASPLLYWYLGGGVALAALLAWLWKKKSSGSVSRTLIVWRQHALEFVRVPDDALNTHKCHLGTFTLSSDSRAWRSDAKGSGTYSIYLGNSASPLLLLDKATSELSFDTSETRAIIDSQLAKQAALAKIGERIGARKIMEWALWAGGIVALIAAAHMFGLIDINQILGMKG